MGIKKTKQILDENMTPEFLFSLLNYKNSDRKCVTSIAFAEWLMKQNPPTGNVFVAPLGKCVLERLMSLLCLIY